MNLYHYPKSRHVRTQTPFPYKNYSEFKPTLKKEFNNTCVYCRTPDHLSEVNYYAVEHYKPKRKFPELETEYTNLYYACGHCNSKKGEFWPTDDQLQAGIFIPNPCSHIMHEHLRSSRDGTVAHHSITGKWTIDSLDLNSPKKVQKRIFYLNTYNNAKRQIKIFEKLLTEIKGKIDDSDEEELSDIEISYLEAIEQCESVNSIIDYIENGPSE